MVPYFDAVDRKWRIAGYESLTFTTEDDAIAAKYLALDLAEQLTSREVRYLKAAQRAEASGALQRCLEELQ